MLEEVVGASKEAGKGGERRIRGGSLRVVCIHSENVLERFLFLFFFFRYSCDLI
jgi:hypothetical protein